ncbi:DUF3038 domain-containing protein [uncultured Prochlorococcus sp.]|uniref:DUF3038 domain-containing protein n=1 Tax=uncultured Prochlorococcus sp. TaxID=159733 RepID=UPI00258EF041|nr:DUF3038 domain-containing protein [uncultured Prochlorococcus sp.]
MTVLTRGNQVSRKSVEKLDLLLLLLETIDLNGIQSLYALSNRLNLKNVLPNKVTIWKLRNNNPLRKSFVTNNIKLNEFDALIRITVEMSKYLYPYIREILKSKEDIEENSVIWNDFNKRFIELIKERFNIDSIRVKKLINQDENDEIIIKSLLILSFCISNQGYQKLKNFLYDF